MQLPWLPQESASVGGNWVQLFQSEKRGEFLSVVLVFVEFSVCVGFFVAVISPSGNWKAPPGMLNSPAPAQERTTGQELQALLRRQNSWPRAG